MMLLLTVTHSRLTVQWKRSCRAMACALWLMLVRACVRACASILWLMLVEAFGLCEIRGVKIYNGKDTDTSGDGRSISNGGH